MRLNLNKTQSMIVGGSRATCPPPPFLFISITSQNSCYSFEIFGFMFDNKITFENHIHSILLSVPEKIGLIKSFRVSEDQDVLLRCFNSFILPCLEYYSPVRSSVADFQLKLLDRKL